MIFFKESNMGCAAILVSFKFPVFPGMHVFVKVLNDGEFAILLNQIVTIDTWFNCIV